MCPDTPPHTHTHTPTPKKGQPPTTSKKNAFFGVIFGAGRILGILRPIYRERAVFTWVHTHVHVCIQPQKCIHVCIYQYSCINMHENMVMMLMGTTKNMKQRSWIAEKVKPELQKANRWEGGEKQTSKDDRIWMAADKCSPPENLFSFYIALTQTL